MYREAAKAVIKIRHLVAFSPGAVFPPNIRGGIAQEEQKGDRVNFSIIVFSVVASYAQISKYRGARLRILFTDLLVPKGA